MNGYVYVLINHSFPNLLKIGKTTHDPLDRATQLDTTGVPTPFVVVFARKFSDCDSAERAVHEFFKDYRSRRNREFFEINAPQAIAFLQQLEGGIEDKDLSSVNEHFFFIYLASWGTICRIGLFKGEIYEDKKLPRKRDIDILSRKLADYYKIQSRMELFEFEPLCRPLEEARPEIENIISSLIRQYMPKTYKFHDDYDGQTLIKYKRVKDYTLETDIYKEDILKLYKTVCLNLVNFARRYDNIFQKKRISALRGNF